jgi:hypothetical protein
MFLATFPANLFFLAAVVFPLVQAMPMPDCERNPYARPQQPAAIRGASLP